MATMLALQWNQVASSIAVEVLLVLAGLLKVIGPVRYIHFRGLWLGIIALASSVVSVLGVCCIPSALLLGYGAYVLSDRSVRCQFQQQ